MTGTLVSVYTDRQINVFIDVIQCCVKKKYNIVNIGGREGGREGGRREEEEWEAGGWNGWRDGGRKGGWGLNGVWEYSLTK